MEEKGQFIVDEKNIEAVIKSVLAIANKERMKPAQVMRPCFKCKQIMVNQACCVILNNGVPEFYCEACTPESLCMGRNHEKM